MRIRLEGWHKTALEQLAKEQGVTLTQVVKQLIADAHDGKENKNEEDQSR